MATELAVQQTLNDKNKLTYAGMTEEVKDQSANDTVSNISTKINLPNAMREISDKDKYEFNYRLHLMLPFTILIFVSYFHELEYILDNNILRILIIVYHALLILFCSAIFIFCIIYKKPFAKFVNTLLFGFVSSNNPKCSLNIFEHRQYAGLWFFVSIIYSSAVTIIDIYIDYFIVPRVVPLALNLTFLIFYKTVKCHQQIMEKQKTVLEKYKNTEKIQHKIDERLQDWQQSKKLINRKMEFIAICLVVLFWHFIATALIDWQIYKNLDPLLAVLVTVIFVLDSFLIIFTFYWVDTIYLHYKFPAIIMDELAAPINAETTNDLIGWWQLRKFYAQCIVQIYTSSFGACIAALIIGSITLALFALNNILQQESIFATVEILCALCYFILVMFLSVSNATNYYSIQLSHANMLSIESMALRKYKADNIDSINDIYDIEIRKYEHDTQHYVVNKLIQDVQNNSDVIQVFGISINSKFMLLLRAASGTLAIAIISILLS